MIDGLFHIMVVDDDLEYAQTCARALERAGFQATAVDSPATGLDMVRESRRFSLVLTDLQMPEMDGIRFLQAIKQAHSTTEVIIMTGYGTIQSAVAAIKAGALEYITKPFDKDELLNAVGRVHKVWKLEKEVRQLKQVITDELHLSGFIFKNELMTTVYKRIAAAAGCNCSVFITGESGTGKEVVANAIHANSARSNGPFVPVNCGALTGTLIESELFGYRKGAFTGADKDYRGLFVAAESGTLFLDEIAEMDRGTQSKLLRSIQDRKIRPVGSVEEQVVDVRFIAATNRNVRQALKDRVLREDLYHRLNVITIDIPPLRMMADEIPELLEYLLAEKAKEHSISGCRFDPRALDRLVDYTWPGNIREACNLVERCLVNGESSVIRLKDLLKQISTTTTSEQRDTDELPTLSQSERDLVVRALRQAKGNKTRAATILGISRPSLYKKIEQYGINESSL